MKNRLGWRENKTSRCVDVYTYYLFIFPCLNYKFECIYNKRILWRINLNVLGSVKI